MADFGFPEGRGNNTDLIAVDHGFILLIGTNGFGGAKVWETRDGRGWSPLSSLELPTVHDGTYWSGQVVVVGGDGSNADGAAIVATSPDGVTWETQEFDGVGPMNDVASSAEVVAATTTAGWVWINDGRTAELHQPLGPAALSGPIVDEERVYVVGNARPVEGQAIDKKLAVYSGSEWSIEDLPDPPELEGYGITAGSEHGDTFVFTGYAYRAGDAHRDQEVAAIVSGDGTDWRLLHGDDVAEFAHPGVPEWAYSSIFVDDEFIAVGNIGLAAAVWASPNGLDWRRVELPVGAWYATDIAVRDNGEVMIWGSGNDEASWWWSTATNGSS